MRSTHYQKTVCQSHLLFC